MTPTLPKWTDAASVAAFLTTIIAFGVGLVSMLHPGFKEPTLVQALVTPASVIVAAAVTAVHVITHRSVQKVAIAAGVGKAAPAAPAAPA